MDRLNGWQRLWWVIAAMFAIVLMFIGEEYVPTKESTQQEFEKQLQVERRYLAEIKQKQHLPDAFSQDFFGGTALADTQKNIANLETRYKSEMDSLWASQVKIRSIFIALWLVLIGTLYFFGAVVGWVVRGFRPSGKSTS